MDELDNTYKKILEELKTTIRTAQIKASVSVNSELITMYWHIGNVILEQQNKKNWGAKVIEALSNDLKKSFPSMQGFSVRNLNYMRKFAEQYSDLEFVQQVVAQIPWGQNILLIDKIKNTQERIWYIKKELNDG